MLHPLSASSSTSSATPIRLARLRAAEHARVAVAARAERLAAGGASARAEWPTAAPLVPAPATATQASSSAGPGFSAVSISGDLGCSADVNTYDPAGVFYDETACATIAFVDGTAYGPASIPAGPSLTPWTPVAQSTSGSGTAGDPFVITTKAAAGGTGVVLTQVDTWAPGTDIWTTSVLVANPNGASVTRLTHARDCYVAASDAGIGQADPASGATYCEGASAALGLIPAAAGATWLEDGYSTVWSYAASDGDLPDTYVASEIDNGQAISWGLEPAATSQSRAWASVLDGGAPADLQGGSSSPSVPPTTCSSAQPVNCATGDFWHTFTDAAVPAHGLPLGFQRTYDLIGSAVDGRMGYGWHDAFDLTVVVAGSTATVTEENGTVLTFDRQPDGSWSAPGYVLDTLSVDGAGAATLTRHESGLTYGFAAGSGRLTTIHDTAGDDLQLAYDTAGHLTSVADGAAGRMTIVWSGTHISSVQDPVGRTTSYTYSASGDLTSSTGPGGASWSFTYDTGHHLTSMTDPRGATTVNTFDSSFRVVSQKQPDGGTITYAYSGDPSTPQGGTTETIDEHGVQTDYAWSNMLLTNRVVSAASFSSSTSYTYDLVTLRLVAVDADGVNHQSLYDTQGRLVGTIDANGGLTAYTYDGNTYRRTSTTSPMGEVTRAQYDALGRMASSTDAGGVVTTYTYGSSAHPGQVTALHDSGGHATTYVYDALGDITHSEVADSSGSVILLDRAFDASGVLYCSVSPSRYRAGVRCGVPGTAVSGATVSTLDAAGRPTVITGPDGSIRRYTYNAAGDTTSSTDQTGRLTTMTYDSAGRILTTRRGAGTGADSTVSDRYDLATGSDGCPDTGQTAYCTSTSDGNRTTVQGYDAIGDTSAFIRPGGGTRVYDHDGAHLIATHLEDGSSTAMWWSGDELTAVNYSDGTTSSVSYGYDSDGRRIWMSDGTGSTDYEYDSAGRMDAETTSDGTVRATYGSDGALAEITYPAGEQVQRGYDAAGRLIWTTDWSGRRTDLTLDDNGAVTSEALPNGRAFTSGYDVNGNLTSRAVSGTTVAMVRSRDAAGRVRNQGDAGLGGPASQSVTYDALGQLSAVSGVHYASDTSGSPVAIGAATQTFDSQLAPATQTTTSGVLSFTTSATGERTAARGANGTATTYNYDGAGDLRELWSVAGPAVSGLSATSGSSAGGSTVTVRGSGFLSGAQAYFGTQAAVTTVISSSTLSVVVPPGSGAADVTVKTIVGKSTPVDAGRYTYLSPTVTALSLASGAASGGQAITISGWNLAGATSVNFGSKAATFTVVSAQKITATTPPGTGTVQVSITTPDGSSAPTASAAFTYHPEPIITSVSPASGPLGGGNTVTLHGYGMTGVTSVMFGDRAASAVKVLSGTSLSAVAPSGSGTVRVQATSAAGSSADVPADLYAYAAGPTVSGISPTTVPSAGGTVLTITGKGFGATATVLVGSVSVTPTAVSSTSITVVAPPGSGTQDVRVASGSATSPVVLKDRLTYVAPTVLALSMIVGPVRGGQKVTVTGTRFTGATQVLFGSAPGIGLTVTSDSSVAVTEPAGVAGTVDVRVVTPEGTSPATSADRYTLTAAPLLEALSRHTAQSAGGTQVTLKGWNLAGVTSVTVGSKHVAPASTTSTSVTITAPRGSGVVSVSATAGTTASVSTTVQQLAYGSVDQRYAYDGDGRLRSRTDPAGVSTSIVWDPFGETPAPILVGSTRLVNGYDALPIEQVDASENVLYYLQDERGSTRALLDSAGGLSATFVYSPDGRVTTHTGTGSPLISFAGGLADGTNLVDFVHRMYDPSTATFLTVDPALDQTGQPYSYAGGDPVNANDRAGLWPTIVIGAIIGAAVGTVASTLSYAMTTPHDQWSLRGAVGAAAGGLVSGTITGACMGAGGVLAGTAGAMACGAVGGAAGSITTQLIAKGNVDWTDVGVTAALGAAGGGIGGWAASRVGQDVAPGTLNATIARWGGLKPSNLVQPGAIVKKWYISTAIGAGIGIDSDATRAASADLYRYLMCGNG